jgi:predicted short-subunit dehydrogenase-like oxidoreductase (DUF2520 family)
MPDTGISFIGAGKVASTLAREFHEAGINIISVFSKGDLRSKILAEKTKAEILAEPLFDIKTRILIVAVPDNALQLVLKDIKCHEETVVVHTAGSYGLEVFPPELVHKGVFYPLQSFSDLISTNLRGVPLIIETSKPADFEKLSELAEIAGFTVMQCPVETRRIIHLSAVFACNFTNYMLTKADSVLGQTGVPFDILYPLVQETVRRAFETGPDKNQTGPALRHDTNTMAKHMDLLSYKPEDAELYRIISESVMNHFKQNGK